MQTNLFAYTEPTLPEVGYVGFVSLNRQETGEAVLAVRSSGFLANSLGSFKLPPEVMIDLGNALVTEGQRAQREAMNAEDE